MAKRHSSGGQRSGSLSGSNSAMMQSTGKYSKARSAPPSKKARRLTDDNSAMTPTPGMQRPGRSLPSTIQNARSSTPTSILNSGRSYFGPLSYSSPNVENRPYAPGGMGAGNRNRKASPRFSKRG